MRKLQDTVGENWSWDLAALIFSGFILSLITGPPPYSPSVLHRVFAGRGLTTYLSSFLAVDIK